MKIKNGFVFSSGDKMMKRDLCFENGVICDSSEQGEYDAEGCYVLPGFIDTHIHGAYGYHFATSKGSMTRAFDLLAFHGITSLLPTISTRSIPDFERAIKNVLAQNDDRVLGFHLEGPFLNKERKGAMKEEYMLAPNAQLIDNLNEIAEGTVRLISVAPELEGSLEFSDYCKDKGIHVSMGHTNATYEKAAEAANHGFTRSTHTYNAMRPLSHRDPGVLCFAMTDNRINCELICDFIHVSAPMVDLLLRSKGYEQVTMISDAELACGMPDGDYLLDGTPLTIKNRKCTYTGTDTIAGSAMNLADGAKNMFKRGYLPEQIAVMACVNPAKVSGAKDRGRLERGYRADVIVLDSEFNVIKVFVKGQEIK